MIQTHSDPHSTYLRALIRVLRKVSPGERISTHRSFPGIGAAFVLPLYCDQVGHWLCLSYHFEPGLDCGVPACLSQQLGEDELQKSVQNDR